MKRLLLNLAPAMAAVALLAAVGAQATTSTRQGDRFKITRSDLTHDDQGYVESIDMLFKVDESGALVLGTSTGTVNVRTWEENMVRLVVSKRTRAMDEGDARRIFDMFRVQAMHGGSDLQFTGRARTAECAREVGVTFTVWVPKSYNLDIKTESGNIDIPRMEGRFTARTSDGKINVDCDPEDVGIEVEDRTSAGSGNPGQTDTAEVKP